MVIQHNIPAINAHRNLGINNAATAKNLEKLSSGFKINRAGDDAAGLAISEKMRGQIRGLAMAEQNANNGISLIQTAEGGLNETHAILQRMRELAVQSVNGTYQEEDRVLIEREYQALKSEIDRIASYTAYNGIKLLDGTTGGVQLGNATPALGNPIAGSWADAVGGPTPTNINTSWSPGLRYGFSTQGDIASNYTGATAYADAVADLANYGIKLTAGGSFATMTAVGAATNNTGTKLVAGDFTGDLVIGWDAELNTWYADLGGFDRASLTDNGTDTTIVFNKTNYGGTTPDTDYQFTLTLANIVFDDTVAQNAGLEHGSFFSRDLGAATVTTATGAITFNNTATIATANFSNMNLSVADEIDDNARLSIQMDYDANAGEWIFASLELLNGFENEDDWNDGTFSNVSYNATSGVFTITNLNDATKQIILRLDQPLNAPTGDDELLSGSMTFTVSAATDRGYTGGVNTGLTANNTTFSNFRLATPNPALATHVPNGDTARANAMLRAMGLQSGSEFTLIGDFVSGANNRPELNGKDAYIITRASAVTPGAFPATGTFDTLLQVGDYTYQGTLVNGTWEFRDTDGTVAATLTNAQVATQTGSIRFNIGDQTAAGTPTALIAKEGAMIGTQNHSALIFQIGANGHADQKVGMYVLNMSAANLGNHAKGMFVDASSIANADDANDAIETLTSAINYVSAQRADLGALQNRLEHTLNNLGVTKENLTAAESSIRDVDMAKEMMEFTKNNILVQAAQAMLAQANQLPQGVLQLLR